jgi:hypothetical protein
MYFKDFMKGEKMAGENAKLKSVKHFLPQLQQVRCAATYYLLKFKLIDTRYHSIILLFYQFYQRRRNCRGISTIVPDIQDMADNCCSASNYLLATTI